jgi:hypothetical protein
MLRQFPLAWLAIGTRGEGSCLMAFFPAGANAKRQRLLKGLHDAKHCLSVTQDVATMWLKYGVGRENRSPPG